MNTRLLRLALPLAVAAAGLFLAAQTPPAQTPAAKSADPQTKGAPAPAAPKAAVGGAFYIHSSHVKTLGFDCELCHTPVKEGSVTLKRPGHDQCMGCHQEAFDNLDFKVCGVCHKDNPPTSAEGLLPFPAYKKGRAVLFEFSHAKHVDPQARVDAKTGFRADCTFCHKFEPKGEFATFPGHVECATCHNETGPQPHLTTASTTQDCRGCHSPEEVDNPTFTKDRRMIAAHVVSGKYVDLKYNHAAHFKVKDEYNLKCTTCHYGVPTSNSLSDLTLPKMIDCVQCHDTSKTIRAEFRMSNCSTCHIDQETGAAPVSHVRNVKPDFHTESFRQHHEDEATAPGAKCFVCHQNVTATANASNQCIACHQVMRPVSHTARWKDDIHGKFAAIDRQSCALCHTTDTCNRCHNQLPSSHAPLALYKAGTHALPAMLDERSCFTCHTFQNTCSECHTRGTAAK
jgi:hypothetical protein